jgi:hypothetical protein
LILGLRNGRKRALFHRVLIPNACALTGTKFRERLGMPNIRADERHGAPLQSVLNFVGDLLEIYSTRYRATVPYSPAIPSQASVHPHGRPLVNRFTGAARAVTLSVAAPALDGRPARGLDRSLRRPLQSPALPREHRQSDAGRRLLRTRSNHPVGKRRIKRKTIQHRRLHHKTHAA